MLQEIKPFLEQDRKQLRQVLEQQQECSNNELYKLFLSQYQEEIQNKFQILLKRNEFNQQFSGGQVSESGQEKFIQLQQQVEQLTQITTEQQRDLHNKDQVIASQTRQAIEREKLVGQLQNQLISAHQEIEKQNMAAEQQANDLRQLHQSRETLIKELEMITVDRNQILEMLKAEKMKMADKLNEINELYDSIQRQKRLVQDDEDRLNRRYSEIQSKSNFQSLAPYATEAQMAKATMSDVPNIVVRKFAKFHSAEIYDIAQNLNGSLIATCGGDRIIRLYDPLNLQSVSQYQSHGDEVYTTLCFSPSFECLLVGSTDHSAQLWQVQTWKLKTRFVGHSDQVTAVDFVGGEKETCITGSKDRQLKVWNVNNGSCLKTISCGSMVNALCSQHNVPLIISAHKDGSVRGYALKSDGKPVFTEKNLFDDAVTSVTMSGDNNAVLLCSKEGSSVKLFDLRMNKLLKTFHDDKYMNSYDHNKVCFGPDEKYIIAGNADSSLISWNIQTGATHKILNKGGHEGVVLCVAYHPVSQQLYSCDSRGNLVIWR